VTRAWPDAEDVAQLHGASPASRERSTVEPRARSARTQASVLATAARLGPMRITELAEIEGVNPTMLSRIVAKLEDTGLLHRHPDPDDRRAALVEATAEGRALQRRLRDERTRLLAEHLARLPDGHAADLLVALPAVEASPTTPTSADGCAGRPHRTEPPRRTPGPPRRHAVGRDVSSLANPNYRRYTRGQAVLLKGTRCSRSPRSWLVLSHRPATASAP
jgi:DNA-binding MarR family transcriptional regulator